MKKITEETEQLYTDFREAYSYIYVERDVIQRFINECPDYKTWGDKERILDFLRDYILSQDLAYDVVE